MPRAQSCAIVRTVDLRNIRARSRTPWPMRNSSCVMSGKARADGRLLRVCARNLASNYGARSMHEGLHHVG